MAIKRSRLTSLIGKHVYIATRQGQMIDGILHKISGDKIYLRSHAKPVTTSAFFNPFTPLVLFDLLAIEEAPFFFNRRFPFFI